MQKLQFKNVADFVQSTVLSWELCNSLKQQNLVTDTEYHQLVDYLSSGRHTQGASYLFTSVVRKLAPADEDKFIKALREGKNDQAIAILQSNSSASTSVQGETLDHLRNKVKMEDWMTIFRAHLSELVRSTSIGIELVNHLLHQKLITISEFEYLMYTGASGPSRAMFLYTTVALRFEDKEIKVFLKGLELSGNIKALNILIKAAREVAGRLGTEQRTKWMQLINANLLELVESTQILNPLVVSLYSNKMIDEGEMHFLANGNISHQDRATRLYTQIASKWDDDHFHLLVTALELSLNYKALGIFNNEPQMLVSTEAFHLVASTHNTHELGNNSQSPIFVPKEENPKEEKKTTKNYSANSAVKYEKTVEQVSVLDGHIGFGKSPVSSDKQTTIDGGAKDASAIVISIANPGNNHNNIYLSGNQPNDFNSILISPKFVLLILIGLILIAFHCLS